MAYSSVFLSMLVFFMVVSAAPTSLVLKRSFPNNGMKLNKLLEMDLHRHARMRQSHIVTLPVHGSTHLGLYYTIVPLGSPPREFHVDIDTGSDILWVNCVSCTGCPQTTGFPARLNYFDPWSSSTSSIVSCSDRKCKHIVHSQNVACTIDNYCSFEVQYVEGSMTSGYFLSDVMHVANIVDGSVAPNSSVPLFFGCSNLRIENLTMSARTIDGIFGFGRHEMSFISQLHSQGVAPKIFSHCLKGDNSSGGILVLGEVVEPDIIYSPLIPKQLHYNLNLESITVNGQMLQIDPDVFKTSRNKGITIDSGSTLAHFVEGAYNLIVDEITRTIPQSVGTTDYNGFHCYLVTTSVLSITDIFPLISLNFANHASLVLRPHDYLLSFPEFDKGTWCLGFLKTQDMTILGDIILKDKIVVYDLVKQRIGWTSYNCSLPINVSTSSSGKSINEKGGGILHLTMILAFLTHVIYILI
ncbi:PREDICTED: aspartic proteinase-like protein 2 isoform X2 [Lupinus angustifolius]|uniref:aspartic proteinase-like protein 2 isoform X2 n=1 Tax=Lupinus angustifolius TaxID=3871 RepID=UPI00092E2FF8|nr:PREDICTED: aspartic proteinase-like protein 2 isoform X2 [Lupinus angustifolius]